MPGVGIPRGVWRPRPVATGALRGRRGDRPRRSRRCRSTPRSCLATEALKLAGSDAQKKKWLPLLAAGEAIGTLAVAEGPQPPRPRNIRTTFGGGTAERQEGAGGRRRGATFAVVLATGRSRRSRRVAGAGRSQAGGGDARNGSRRSIRRASMPSSPSRTPPAELLGADGEGWRLLERLYDARRGLLRLRPGGRRRGGDVRWRATTPCSATPSAAPSARTRRSSTSSPTVRQARAGALQRLLRRLALSDRRRATCRSRRRRRASPRPRPIDFAVEGKHPDPWRHRLHLGGRHAVPLPPRARDGAVDSAGRWRGRTSW